MASREGIKRETGEKTRDEQQNLLFLRWRTVLHSGTRISPTHMSPRAFITLGAAFAAISTAGAVTVGFGPNLNNGAQDTPAGNSGANQMRQNINITNTVDLAPGVYRATSWSYNAAPDSTVPGVTQPVFPFITRINSPGNHTVLASGATIDTEPGIQNGVAFGGANDTFTIPLGGATIAAGIQNPSQAGVQNSILTDTSFGQTDHANSGNFDDAASAGATLDSRSFGGLTRTYGFSVEVELIPEPSSLALVGLGGLFLLRRRRS